MYVCIVHSFQRAISKHFFTIRQVAMGCNSERFGIRFSEMGEHPKVACRIHSKSSQL